MARVLPRSRVFLKTESLMFSFALLGTAACSSGVVVPPEGSLLTRSWGGTHIGITFTESGGAIEYDCARGTINEPVRIGSNGSFVASGFHFRGHGGPVRINEISDSVTARYSGTVHNNVMSILVRLPADSLGPYSLVQDASPRVFRCL